MSYDYDLTADQRKAAIAALRWFLPYLIAGESEDLLMLASYDAYHVYRIERDCTYGDSEWLAMHPEDERPCALWDSIHVLNKSVRGLEESLLSPEEQRARLRLQLRQRVS